VLRRKSRQLLVQRRQTRLAVHHQHQQGCVFERHARLAKNLRGDQRFVVRHNAAGVHNFQHPAVPFGLAVHAVAGDAGLVGYDRAAGAGQSVKQCGLANVRASHDHQRW